MVQSTAEARLEPGFVGYSPRMGVIPVAADCLEVRLIVSGIGERREPICHSGR